MSVCVLKYSSVKVVTLYKSLSCEHLLMKLMEITFVFNITSKHLEIVLYQLYYYIKQLTPK